MNFIAQIDPGEVCLNYESDHYRWEKIEDALKLPLNQPTKNLILELSFISDTQLKFVWF